MINKYVATDWVKKVILSCETSEQLKVSRNLIDNHLTMFEDVYLHSYLDNIEETQFWKINEECTPLAT